jgi:hypothetical protein
MKRPLTITLGALALLIGFPSARALGQYNPYRPAGTLPPAYSPYLNLLRGGNSFATNYYGLVRPEIGFRNSILGLQQQTALNSYELQTGQTGQLQTGHPVQFLNYSHYFGNLGSRAGAGRPGGATTSGLGQGLIQGGGASPTPSATAGGRR